MLKKYRITLILFCIFAITACANNKLSKVYYDYDHGYHTVLMGETLYSIAFRHGVDYRRLAAWNGIRSPYTIYAGQRIRLTAPPVSSKKYAAKNQTAKSKSISKPKLSTAKQTSTSATKKVSSKPVKHDWGWPTKGKIIRTYSAKTGGNKGIDIEGKIGQAIFAASSGKVVYSGNGLLGYGNLIIVKHSEQFLSAYAHNRKLLVQEGGMVVRGQKIAEMGKSGTNTPKLHFEIRQNGKPVDPLRYLPRN